jgi:serine/threonine-protein kinase
MSTTPDRPVPKAKPAPSEHLDRTLPHGAPPPAAAPEAVQNRPASLPRVTMPAQPAATAAEATQVFRDKPNTAKPHQKPAPPSETMASTRPGDLEATEIVGESAGRPPRESGDATELFEESPGVTVPVPKGRAAVPPPAATKVATAAAPSGPRPADRPPEVFGDFRLDKKLGEGGMGAVYKAHQISMDRVVALKLLAKNLASNAHFVERFYREARTMAKLDHPNIVRGYAVGENEGQHFVAMEFIDGQSMQKWMDKLGKLSVGDAVHVVLRAAYALQHAHEQSLVHRDIKPDNILMTTKGVVKVADLGLAKNTDDDMSLTQSGTGFGTPHYMPLEQYRDAKRVDGRADIFALGVTLYYFLSGKYPFSGETHFDVIKAKELAKTTPVRRLNPEVPERLDLMIDKMVQKDAAHRYQSCAAVIEALESLGVANEAPSFVAGAAATAARPGPVPARPGGTPPKPKASAPGAAVADEAARELWVLRCKDGRGQKVKKQVSTGRLKQLIERGEIDTAGATVHRVNEETQRPLGSYPEFASLVQSKAVQARADRRSQKMENAYESLERQASRQKTIKAIKGLLRNTASLVTLIVVLASLAFGGWWLFKNKDRVVKQVQNATQGAPPANGPAPEKK